MRTTLALLTGLVVTCLLAGWGQPARSSQSEAPGAARAVAAIRAGVPDVGAVPSDFAAVMGYRPALRGTSGRETATRADGGCSSPIGPTRYGFADACRQHDYGYDLLRYAAARHQPLGPWARRAIDDRFARQVSARCTTPVCSVAAAVYVAAVRVNSWRQGWGVPAVEHPASALRPVLAGLLAALMVGAAGARAAVRQAAAGVAARAQGRHAAAVAGLGIGIQPGMLPRPLWVQALIGGLLAVQGYAVCALLGRVVRRRRSRPAPRPGAAIAVLAGIAVAVLAAQVGQARVAAAVGAPAPGVGAQVLAAALGAGLAAVLIGCGLAVMPGARRLVQTARRRRVAAVLLAGALMLPGGSAAAATQAGTKASAFVDSAPTAAAIRAATGRPAQRPLRLYVGLDDAGTPAGRSALAVSALRRSGALDRSVLLIAVPTGSGWVNPAAVSALEYLHGGDVATIAVQYANSPSWMAYLRGGGDVRAQVRGLLDAVAGELRSRAGPRPRVLVYGESLGAWGGLTAFPEGIAGHADGALWAGVPAGAPVDARAGQRILVHPDDPVRVWSPELLIRPPRGWPHAWLPLLSFWQVTGDVLGARLAPQGHGHRYGAELVDAWQGLAPASADTRGLRAIRGAVDAVSS